MERGCPYLYTGSTFRVTTFSFANPEGVATTPFGKYVWEKPSGEQLRNNAELLIFRLLSFSVPKITVVRQV